MGDSATSSRPAIGPRVEHPAAALARGGPDVHDPVRTAYDVHVVLDDEERVAGGLEPVEDLQQRLGVRGVQARRGLVEHVDDAEEARAQLGGDPQALRLAGDSVVELRPSDR